MPYAKQYRDEVKQALAVRPYKTPLGQVAAMMATVHMGYPGGNHSVPEAWVYQHTDSGLEMVFQFYENFTNYDLLCKVTIPGEYPIAGEGASIQFNSKDCIVSDPPYIGLVHHGRVTVRTAIRRAELVDRMKPKCQHIMQRLGIAKDPDMWPISLGNTEDIGVLLDNMFLYAYCVEQAKRNIRGETPLPSIS